MADILYVDNGTGTISYVCNLGAATPYVAPITSVTSSSTTSNYGLGYDPASNTLFAWDDDTRTLVVIE